MRRKGVLTKICFVVALLTTHAAATDGAPEVVQFPFRIGSSNNMQFVPKGVEHVPGTCWDGPSGEMECQFWDVEPTIRIGRSQEMIIGDRSISFPFEGACADYGGILHISLERTSNYGGHDYLPHDGPQPIGKLSLLGIEDGDYLPQGPFGSGTDADVSISVPVPAKEINEALIITLPETAEEVKLFISVTCYLSPPAHLEANLYFKVRMKVPFVRLENMSDVNGVAVLNIERATNSHGESAGYGTSQLSDKLTTLNDEIAVCLESIAPGTSSNLTVTGASLEHGGLYDFQHTWMDPHKNHRIGVDADIGLTAINDDQVQLSCFETARIQAKLNAPIISERIVLNRSGLYVVTGNHDHIHMTTGEQHFYPLDQTSAFNGG